MNAILAIYPYRHNGLWVFDDERAELHREPFIAGADAMIDKAVVEKGIERPEDGFRMIFSAGPFPGYDFRLEWVREGDGGNWYKSDRFEVEGWLCPALFKYFDQAPREIYTKIEPKDA
ncbi:MAG: DUF6717 family protein [Planctomycetota bacterium]|jgi:hypothetical protein